MPTLELKPELLPLNIPADESMDDAEGKTLLDEAMRELFGTKYDYNPDQPRVPAGESDGGQWTSARGGMHDANDKAVPVERLDHPQSRETLTDIYGRTGELTDHDTLQELKIYPLQPLIDDPAKTNEMLKEMGFKVEYFAFHNDPEAGVKFRVPNLKTKGYGSGTLWIYDPRVAAGSFEDTEYTRAWRIFHEAGHATSEQFMLDKYGPSKREGRLGQAMQGVRGNPDKKQVPVTLRPLTLLEAQRAVEWEDTAFRTQRILLESKGVKISDTDFNREYNTNIGDAIYRVMTGGFGDPGHYGYKPSTTRVNVKSLLKLLENQEAAIAAKQGRAPTKGIDLNTWRPVSTADLTNAIEKRKLAHYERKRARADFRRYLLRQPGPGKRGGDASRALQSGSQATRTVSLGLTPYPYHRPLTKYESRVDFAKAENTFDHITESTGSDLADKIAELAQRAVAAAKSGGELTPPDFSGPVNQFLERAFTAGRSQGEQELPNKIVQKLAYNPDQPRDEKGRWTYWHGSPSGDFGPGAIHVGTRLAAKEALEARIGIPAVGEWDGNRVYGKTKLAGRKTLLKKDPKGYNMTGANADPPDEDYYPKGDATYSDGTKVPMTAKPNIFQVQIIGPMTNSPSTPHSDEQANALMTRQKKIGNAKRGFFYKNIGEDEGSISAVVPSSKHLKRFAYNPDEPRDDRGRWVKDVKPAVQLKDGTIVTATNNQFHHIAVERETYARLFPEKLGKLGEFLDTHHWMQFRDSFYGDEKYGVRGVVLPSGKFVSRKELDKLGIEEPGQYAYNPDEPRDDHGRWTDEGGKPLEVYLTPDQVTPFKADWGSGETGFQLKDKPGAWWKGTPMSIGELPPEIYHVTTAKDAIEKSGYLRGQNEGGGMGGGNGLAGVSFTTSKDTAEFIEREMKRTATLATTVRSREDYQNLLDHYANQDASMVRDDPEAVKEVYRARDSALENFDVNIKDAVRMRADPESAKYVFGDPYASTAAENYRTVYLNARDNVVWKKAWVEGKGLDATIKNTHPLRNPLLMGGTEAQMKLKPDQIGIIKVNRDLIPKNALVRHGTDDFLQEVRVHADVPIRAGVTHKFSNDGQEVLIYAGFDPNQERDEKGKWTTEGGMPSIRDENSKLRSEKEYRALYPNPVTMAEVSGPYPYPQDVTDRLEAERGYQKHWEKEIRNELSWGKITGEEAKAAGYYESEGNWAPLPPELYHVTVGGDAAERGLIPKGERDREHAIGLGGGSSDTISLTQDEKYAQTIYQGILEARAVATGEVTPKDMWDKAIAGNQGSRPFATDLARGYGQEKDWMPGQPLPSLIQNLIDGTTYQSVAWYKGPKKTSMLMAADEMPPGSVPVGYGVKGGDGVTRYGGFNRPMTPEEQARENMSFFKYWLAYRQQAGGPDNPVPFGDQETSLPKVKPSDIRILKLTPKAGAQGVTNPTMLRAEGEWRIYRGDIVNIVGSNRPQVKLFATFSPTEALQFLRDKGLEIAGILDTDLTEAAREIIGRVADGQLTLDEGIADLRDIFEPWIEIPQAVGPSGMVGLGFPPGEMAPENVLMGYRLENMIRTPLNEAYNEGRKALADETDGYVIGYQYSAILDERTTEICRENDGLMIPADDPRLEDLTPPEHFQCRSILVFVTQDDEPVEWSTDEELDAAWKRVQDEFKGE